MMNSTEKLPFQLVAPKVIAETPRWLVISKPPGWLTIPGRASPKPDTPAAPVLSEWAKNWASAPIYTVHRLDRDTSGVVLFARTEEDHKQANLWFQNRKVKKIYHCLAQGCPSLPILKIDLPIEGAPSTTQVEVKESYQEGFLAQVLPRTGRRHQIRIHLSKKGYPIWGDLQYQGPREVVLGEIKLGVPRVALHASSLELPTGEIFKAEFSPDFAYWLVQLRKEGKRV